MLDQGRRRLSVSPIKISPGKEYPKPNFNQNEDVEDFPSEQFSDDSDDQNFTISVNVGGVEKKIFCRIDIEPEQIVERFIKEQGIDQKYKNTLIQLIKDQINNIKGPNNENGVSPNGPIAAAN